MHHLHTHKLQDLAASSIVRRLARSLRTPAIPNRYSASIPCSAKQARRARRKLFCSTGCPGDGFLGGRHRIQTVVNFGASVTLLPMAQESVNSWVCRSNNSTSWPLKDGIAAWGPARVMTLAYLISPHRCVGSGLSKECLVGLHEVNRV